ncbi:NAD(P)-dependent dehydrogenase, short-chain alcohol dehydrogenase family [Nitrosomonas sp. PY1]|uniref:YciK family oxidoreductase n=1 Tax=Nitrosomonas sp. PY1 TaxID=1803906 RepID=UPI001FC7FE5A|nr:YciK family oxidoreductase [Nitrosomonas sp. PY1]GKS68751.1 NAD(P)-dependent dehydrogenase, short-chain alcohol dehydrogenase family [Nitrosomonas sp. PY1]
METFKDYLPAENLLQGRVILITGAGQGIGREAALAYAAHGATVILHGRKVQKLESVFDEIALLGKSEALIYPLDLEKAEEKDFQITAQSIAQQIGRLDGILYNAAFLHGLTPMQNQTVEQWRTVLQINLISSFALTKACLPLLKAAPDASIIMTSDSHTIKPTAYWGPFLVAKTGIEALVKSLADEWEQTIPHLRINSIIPGAINSPQRAKTHPGEVKQNMRQPKDIMSTYLYLMGSDSCHVSGKTIFC